MNQSFQQPLFLDGSFEDIDQFSEATRAWDLAFRQLEAGTFLLLLSNFLSRL